MGTYAVVPITLRIGLIEWVKHTMPIKVPPWRAPSWWELVTWGPLCSPHPPPRHPSTWQPRMCPFSPVPPPHPQQPADRLSRAMQAVVEGVMRRVSNKPWELQNTQDDFKADAKATHAVSHRYKALMKQYMKTGDSPYAPYFKMYKEAKAEDVVRVFNECCKTVGDSLQLTRRSLLSMVCAACVKEPY